VTGISRAQRGPGEVRVQLDRVDGRDNLGAGRERVQILGLVVAHADRTGSAVRQNLLGGPVGAHGPLELLGHRPVQELQVDVPRAKAAQAAVETAQRLLIVVVADPQLGRDKDPERSTPGLAYGLADLALVP